jgi:hypothetical protein
VPHQCDAKLGYYQVPTAYLGYKPDDAPSVLLHCIKVLGGLLFEEKSLNNPDTLTWTEAMSESPDNVTKWLEAVDKEIKALEEKETWKEVPLSEATIKVIPGTWVFRQKIAPDGTTTKWKARIFLVLSLLLHWTIKALNFANAFVQATLDEDVFAYLPRGFRSMLQTQGDRACLKLRKSLYGLTCAPRLWFMHLEKALCDIGFQKRLYDKCLLY